MSKSFKSFIEEESFGDDLGFEINEDNSDEYGDDFQMFLSDEEQILPIFSKSPDFTISRANKVNEQDVGDWSEYYGEIKEGITYYDIYDNNRRMRKLVNGDTLIRVFFDENESLVWPNNHQDVLLTDSKALRKYQGRHTDYVIDIYGKLSNLLDAWI